MNLFRKIFSSSSNEQKKAPKKEAENKYLPKKELPADELFTINFNKNGGKFLYTESFEEAHEFLKEIIKEKNAKRNIK